MELLSDITCWEHTIRILMGIITLYYFYIIWKNENELPSLLGCLALMIFSQAIVDAIHLYSRIISFSNSYAGEQFRTSPLWAIRLIPGGLVLGYIMIRVKKIAKEI